MNKKYIALAVAALMLTACSNDDKAYDATGTFEATEITVSAEQTGKLIQFAMTEGDLLSAGAQVGLIDTVQLYLKARQVGATRLVYQSGKPEIQKQIATLQQQLVKAKQEVARFEQLVKDGAANQKLLDDAQSQVEVLQRQIIAQQSQLNTSTRSLSAQMNTADVQKLEIADQLQKCHILSPINGVVLDKYAQQGEFATIGRPLFKIADVDNMYLRAYITNNQLQKVKTGQTVTVYADYGNGERKEYQGKVTWISSKSEFTPKTILTDDERADLVYAIKIAIKNNGGIKIGMYGEVKF